MSTANFAIPTDIAAELAIVTARIDVLDCRHSFSEFVKRAWHVIEPGTPLIWGKAMQAICDHLQAISEGRLLDTLINVPPGFSKSILTSVLWPAWEWTFSPHMSIVATSHGFDLAERDGRRCRLLIKSEWYQARWPMRLVKDTDVLFTNEFGGRRECCAFESITGKRGSRVILDDPHSAESANYPLQLAKTTRLFRESLLTRKNNPETDVIVCIMQRLHSKDVAGVILDEDFDFAHLMLPMEFEPDRKCVTPIGFEDWRTEPGELLFPERIGPDSKALKNLKKMGAYAWAGQMQQRPVPRDGGVFQWKWFEGKTVTKADVPPGTRWKRWFDLAATASANADYTAGVLLGKAPDGRYFIGHSVRFREEYHQRDMRIKAQFEFDVATYGRANVEFYIPKDPAAAGKVQAQSLVAAFDGFNVRAVREMGDKVVRAEPFARQCEAGNVYVIDGPWVQEFMDELCNFPNGNHKDQTDAVVNAYAQFIIGGDPTFALAAPDFMDRVD